MNNKIESNQHKTETEMIELHQKISTLPAKIYEFEKEKEESLLQRDMERELFWKMQDILRAEIKNLKHRMG